MRTRPSPALTTGFFLGPALWLASAAALLPATAQAGDLALSGYTSYYAYSYAKLYVDASFRYDSGEAQCYCGVLDSLGHGPGGNSASGGYLLNYSNDQALVSPMNITAYQTVEAGTMSIVGSVAVQGDSISHALATHVGNKPDWDYRFLAVKDLDFTFNYDLRLTGTPLAPTLLVDGVSLLAPQAGVGTVTAHLAAGSMHQVVLQNALVLDKYFFTPGAESAGMVMFADWTLTESITTSVPEPGSWVLALQGLALLGWAARRRRLDVR